MLLSLASKLTLDRKVTRIAAILCFAAPSIAYCDAGDLSAITPNALPNTRIVFTGYIKLDALVSKYDGGVVADGAAIRDFYLPGAIPVGAVGKGAEFDMHVKQSRFIIGTDTESASLGKISSRLEFDLFGSALGDERATNTYGLQVRQVYVQTNHWLAGQVWTNFMDAAVLPETTDLIGPTDGAIFVRQPMLRYTTGNFTAAIENPDVVVTVPSNGSRLTAGDNSVPDVTAAYAFKFDKSFIRLSALARQLKYQTTGAGAVNDSAYVGALSVAGKVMLGRDDIRFTLTAGNGVGRYIGVNFANDAILASDGRLDPIAATAGFIAWRHVWSSKWRSTLMVAASNYDNNISATAGAGLISKSSRSWAVNSFWALNPKFDLGLEFRDAKRKTENGDSGSLRRWEATAKYFF